LPTHAIPPAPSRARVPIRARPLAARGRPRACMRTRSHRLRPRHPPNLERASWQFVPAPTARIATLHERSNRSLPHR
jgi:hypothetical protein